MRNVSERQDRLLKRIRTRVPDLVLRWSSMRGVASLIEGTLLPWKKVKRANNIIITFLREYGTLVGPPGILKAHYVTEVKQSKVTGTYRVKAYQVFKNLPVYGATLIIFADRKRGIYRVQSSLWREINVTLQQKIGEDDLQRRLHSRLRRDRDGARFEKEWEQEEESGSQAREYFPLLTQPKLYLYPMAKGFHPAYNVWAYQPTDWLGADGSNQHTVDRVELMFDAATGKVLWEEPAREGQTYTDTIGDGLSTLQDNNGNYLSRNLNVVKDTSGDFFMINRLNTPHIITHDAGGTDTGLVNKLKNNTDISQDADGHWNNTTTSCNTANRTASQQPEVDCHFYAEEAWNFYHNLIGWDGFDDGNWGNHCPLRLVAHIGMDANAYFSKYSEWDAQLNADKYYGYLAFYDGECVAGNITFDFIAGDPIIFGHEYQHAITFFGASKSTGQPGHLYGSMWLGAIREGYSDALGCLRRGLWTSPPFWRDGVLRNGQPFRRIEFPRSTNTDSGSSYCDHYDDLDSTKDKYFHSTLLSHVAYLVGQGGIHQRVSRAAEFIPVRSVGLDRTAEIFLYALTQYYDTIPTNLQGPTLIEAGRLLLDAAKDVSGSDKSCEYVYMRRALYAVGLYPYDDSYNKQTYGGEACMLPWANDWRFSQPYLNFPALWWRSPDLFINNNGNADYDAVIGQENKLFARVRNIGDQSLSNVKVRFYFAPCGTNLPPSIAGWHPCTDQAGNACILDILSLAAGSMNFTDPNSPPLNQAVNWYLDPTYVTSDVNHFCVRAVIECSAPNHNHNCPNQVQSNVQHVTADSVDTDELTVAFEVHNWQENPFPANIQIVHTLPKGFILRYRGKTPLKRMVIKRGKPEVARWQLIMPKKKPSRLEPPFEGKVIAILDGKVSGRMEGQLSNVRILSRIPKPSTRRQIIKLEGMLSGMIEKGKKRVTINGRFIGELNLRRTTITGQFHGGAAFNNGKFLSRIRLEVKGALEPLRAVHFTQIVEGKPAGGVTVNIKATRLSDQHGRKRTV